MNHILNFGEFIAEGKRHRRNKKVISANCIRMGLSPNKPSHGNDFAKIQINRETAIENLEELEKSYQHTNQIRGFLTNLKNALELKRMDGASEYGIVDIPKEDGSILKVSISPTNHHANAQTYIDHNCNCEYNLKIAVRKSKMKGNFKPHDLVVLDEFAYTSAKIKGIDNALSLIIKGIIDFLKTGVYTDLTGVAVPYHSPKEREIASQNITE